MNMEKLYGFTDGYMEKVALADQGDPSLREDNSKPLEGIDLGLQTVEPQAPSVGGLEEPEPFNTPNVPYSSLPTAAPADRTPVPGYLGKKPEIQEEDYSYTTRETGASEQARLDWEAARRSGLENNKKNVTALRNSQEATEVLPHVETAIDSIINNPNMTDEMKQRAVTDLETRGRNLEGDVIPERPITPDQAAEQEKDVAGLGDLFNEEAPTTDLAARSKDLVSQMQGGDPVRTEANPWTGEEQNASVVPTEDPAAAVVKKKEADAVASGLTEKGLGGGLEAMGTNLMEAGKETLGALKTFASVMPGMSGINEQIESVAKLAAPEQNELLKVGAKWLQSEEGQGHSAAYPGWKKENPEGTFIDFMTERIGGGGIGGMIKKYWKWIVGALGLGAVFMMTRGGGGNQGGGQYGGQQWGR